MTQRKNKIFTLIISFTLLVVTGITTGFLFSRLFKEYILAYNQDISNKNTSTLGFGSLEAESIEELVQKSDVIVVGKTGPVIGEGSFWGYDELGSLITSPPKNFDNDPPLLAIKYVDYEIEIQQTLKDDGSLNPGKILTLRIPDLGSEGDNPEQEIVIAEPDPIRTKSKSSRRRPNADGKRRIFVLKKNPDNKTYGPYFFSQGLLIIDGSKVTKSNGKRSEVKVGNSSDPSKFIQQLKEIINQK